MSLDQDHFRFRNDDGSETTATWLAATDTAPDAFDPDVDTDFRLRLAIFATDGSIPNSTLEYSLNGGSWTAVTTSSDVVRNVSSANFADGDPTTQQISAGDFGSFGEMDSNGLAGASAGEFDTSTEHEFMLRVLGDDVEPSDTLQIRADGMDTYSVTPEITFAGAFPPGDARIGEYIPDQIVQPRGRQYRSGLGGHFADALQPLHTDPETITADKFGVEAPAVMRRKAWRPEGHFAYTEVPVVPDVIEHGWEVQPQLQQRSRLRRWQHLLGQSAFTQDLVTLATVACVGELTVTPRWLGKLRTTPRWDGELDVNVEGGT